MECMILHATTFKVYSCQANMVNLARKANLIGKMRENPKLMEYLQKVTYGTFLEVMTSSRYCAFVPKYSEAPFVFNGMHFLLVFHY